MDKQTESCCERSISYESSAKSSDNSEDLDDTLEVEIGRLETTVNKFHKNDLSECCKSAENLGDDPDLYDNINEKTITNNDCDSDSCEDVSEKTIIITNFVVPTPVETAESDNHFEKQKWSATETWDLHKLPDNETNVYKEVFSSDQGKTTNMKESHAVPSRVSSKAGENEGTENSSESTVCGENCKTSDSNGTSSDFLNIHPTTDSELETLIKSPVTSGVNIINASLEFSPFRTFQGNWLTSSPKVTNSEEYQQSKLTITSPRSVIQNKLVSLVSLLQDKKTETEEQDLKACHLVISKVQCSPQKLTIQQLVKSSTESQSNKESSSSVIILEELNFKKVSSGSFLNLDISQDYKKEWFTDDEDGECDNIAHFISSTPNRNGFSSSSKRKFFDFHNGESFVVLNETGEVSHADSQTKAAEPFSAGNNNTKDLIVKDEPKSVQLGDHEELNISVKHAAVVRYPLETITGVKDEVAKPGEVPHAETQVAEPLSAEKNNAKDLNGSVKEVKDEPKTVEFGDHEDLNISVKHVAVVEHSLETVTADNDKVPKPEVPYVDDEGDEDEGYVKEIKVIKSDYLFTSEDPEENADNFDPGWDVLRNLKTDQERYKAVRERWRSLVIPNPDIDLTYYSYRENKDEPQEEPAEGCSETQLVPLVESRHKRTHSDPSSSSEERRGKRLRTKSCTILFDVKLKQLREQIDDERHQLLYEEAQAVEKLHNVQRMQEIKLQNYYGVYQPVSWMQTIHMQNYYDGYQSQMQMIHTQNYYSGFQPMPQMHMQNYYGGFQPMSQMHMQNHYGGYQPRSQMHLQNYYGGSQPKSHMQILHEKFLQEQRMRQSEDMIQKRKEEMIRKFFESTRQTHAEQEKKMHALEQASTEVKAFCKFYKGLEETEDKDISAYLSETQVEDVWETEDFYEKSEKLYV